MGKGRFRLRYLLPLVNLLVVVAASEAFFRVVGFDFSYEERAWNRLPVFYRQPTVPTGEVFFRRLGSQVWTGQVRSARLQQLGVEPNPYIGEPAISVAYDDAGFRNPDGLSDWRVAVAGDSFTELGHLTDEELFTSVLAEIMDVSVLNLGASHTGPLTHLSYLRDYGLAAGTTHSIIVFFEGNDLDDLNAEYAALAKWDDTGERSYREFRRQTSFVKAIGQAVHVVQKTATREKPDPVTAYFESSAGREPVTFSYTPPGSMDMSVTTIRRLGDFLDRYAAWGEDRNIVVSLAFMPSKLRVLHDQVNFSATAAEGFKTWRPTDLPELIAELCDRRGVAFLNLTPALALESKIRKQLPYSSIYDTHLNGIGSRVVGQELARHLSGARERVAGDRRQEGEAAAGD